MAWIYRGVEHARRMSSGGRLTRAVGTLPGCCSSMLRLMSQLGQRGGMITD